MKNKNSNKRPLIIRQTRSSSNLPTGALSINFLVFFTVSFFAYHSPTHAMSCTQIFSKNFKTKVEIQGDFDPALAFEQAGVSPRSLKLKVKHNPAGHKGNEETTIDFTLMSGKKEIGSLDLYETFDGHWATYSGLRGAFQGKGLGTLLYLIGAEVVFRLYPKTTSLISYDGSVEANFMWEKLVRTGHAKKSTEDPPSEPHPRWVYELEPNHITPQLSQFITTRTVLGSRAVKATIKKQD